MLVETMGISKRLAPCKAVGLARSTYSRIPIAQTPADPDAELRTWLRTYASKHPLHGFRRAWAALREISSCVAAQSRPMFRWAVSIASATPRP